MSQDAFVVNIDLSLAPKLKEALESRGFLFSAPPYTLYQAKSDGVIVTVYSSGKLMVQGKNKKDIIEFYIEPEILGHFGYSNRALLIDRTPRIGIDEAGKGDLFGPLCIGGVFADEKMIDELQKMGVRDSKSMNDQRISSLAKKIRALCPVALIRLFPAKYNELYQNFRNLNRLLAWGHATALEELSYKTECSTAVIDQFADERVVLNALEKKGLSLNLTQRHKGESDIVVAAASIIARAAFVDGIDLLSKEAALTLPKGASKQVIVAGKKIVAQHGEGALGRFAKLHFKTIQEILRA